jgi:hypothetical protein
VHQSKVTPSIIAVYRLVRVGAKVITIHIDLIAHGGVLVGFTSAERV